MLQITLPDGTIKQVEKGVSAMHIAKDISEGLARNVLACLVDDEVWDANRPLESDCSFNPTHMERRPRKTNYVAFISSSVSRSIGNHLSRN